MESSKIFVEHAQPRPSGHAIGTTGAADFHYRFIKSHDETREVNIEKDRRW